MQVSTTINNVPVTVDYGTNGNEEVCGVAIYQDGQMLDLGWKDEEKAWDAARQHHRALQVQGGAA